MSKFQNRHDSAPQIDNPEHKSRGAGQRSHILERKTLLHVAGLHRIALVPEPKLQDFEQRFGWHHRLRDSGQCLGTGPKDLRVGGGEDRGGGVFHRVASKGVSTGII